jgi:hypothetical protein
LDGRTVGKIGYAIGRLVSLYGAALISNTDPVLREDAQAFTFLAGFWVESVLEQVSYLPRPEGVG